MKNSEIMKDEGLRQAVQHKNKAAERMTLSENFTDRLMQRIGEQKPKRRRTWLYTAISVAAASIVLLITFHLLNSHEVTKVEQTMVVKQMEQKKEKPKDVEEAPMPTAKKEKPVVAKAKMANNHPRVATATQQTPTAIPTTDSLDYYIDKIERELAQVDESIYIERMNKVIRADERLQRIVSSYILHTLDREGRPLTAENCD